MFDFEKKENITSQRYDCLLCCESGVIKPGALITLLGEKHDYWFESGKPERLYSKDCLSATVLTTVSLSNYLIMKYILCFLGACTCCIAVETAVVFLLHGSP